MARKPKVNIVGVNGLGAVSGMHPAVGAGLAAGVGTGLAIGLRRTKSAKLVKYSELIGGGAALAVSGAMMVSPKTRAAGFTGVVVALLTNGLRFLESQTTKASATAGAGFGIVSPQQVPTLGAYAANVMPLAGNMGAVSAQQMQALGAVQAEQRQLAGPLPTFQGGLGGHYGATVMG